MFVSLNVDYRQYLVNECAKGIENFSRSDGSPSGGETIILRTEMEWSGLRTKISQFGL